MAGRQTRAPACALPCSPGVDMRPDEIGRMTLMIDERERGVRTPYTYCVGVFNNTCILELANKHTVLSVFVYNELRASIIYLMIPNIKLFV
jgi:hypothetical protein